MASSTVVGEQSAQKRQRAVLVDVVHAAQRRRLAQVVQQVAEVVQQRGGDQRIARAFGLAQRSRLQRVLQLRYGLAAVLFAAALFEREARCRQSSEPRHCE
jgi:hypothetical protein